MNYLYQIKGFWIAQDANQLNDSAIAMYFYLLEVWNVQKWAGSFKRNNYKVMADLSIKSYKTLQSVRDRLKQAGVLTYKQRNGDANVEYTMADLSIFYRGSGEGLGKGLVQGSGKGSVVLNINRNETETKTTLVSLFKQVRGNLPTEILEQEAGKLLNKRPDINPEFDLSYINSWAQRITIPLDTTRRAVI